MSLQIASLFLLANAGQAVCSRFLWPAKKKEPIKELHCHPSRGPKYPRILSYLLFCKKNFNIFEIVKTKETFANLHDFGCICEGLFRVHASWQKLLSNIVLKRTLKKRLKIFSSYELRDLFITQRKK